MSEQTSVADEAKQHAPVLRSVPQGVMVLTARQILDANAGLTSIMNNQRVMPMTVKYRMARMRRAIMIEAEIFSPQRDKVIEEIGDEVMQTVPNPKPTDRPLGEGELDTIRVSMVPRQWKVPDAKMLEFQEAVKPLLDTEVEVAVTPILLSELGDDCTIEQFEFELLGELITE